MKESEEEKCARALQEDASDQGRESKNEKFLPLSVMKKKNQNMVYNSGEEEEEEKKHAMAVAEATAAAAQAAAVAAQAAAEVVRLTGGGCGGRSRGSFSYGVRSREDRAAVKIQAAFRGYLVNVPKI